MTEVLGKLEEAATALGAYVTQTVEDRPSVVLGASLAAGFVVGGGLLSPLGTRMLAVTARATAGNVVSLITLDLLRRALEDGESRGGTQSADAH